LQVKINIFTQQWTINSQSARLLCDPKLVLNNNYHLVHHDFPHVPWYALKRVYEARREAYLARNGGFLVNGPAMADELCVDAGVRSPVRHGR
jgi:fatty acid desaturase